jgi:hypothetical protein
MTITPMKSVGVSLMNGSENSGKGVAEICHVLAVSRASVYRILK